MNKLISSANIILSTVVGFLVLTVYFDINGFVAANAMLALAAFLSVLEAKKARELTGRIADSQRKDAFSPMLYVTHLREEGDILNIHFLNSGHGIAKLMRHNIQQGGKVFIRGGFSKDYVIVEPDLVHKVWIKGAIVKNELKLFHKSVMSVVFEDIYKRESILKFRILYDKNREGSKLYLDTTSIELSYV